jgi:hypothetical protein
MMALNLTPVAEDLDLRVDVTWVNLDDRADWTILRYKSSDPIEKLVVSLGKVVEKLDLDYIFNVSASKHALHVTVGSTKPLDEIRSNLWL